MCFRSSANQIFSHAPLAFTLLSFIISPLSFRETDAYQPSIKQKSPRSFGAAGQTGNPRMFEFVSFLPFSCLFPYLFLSLQRVLNRARHFVCSIAPRIRTSDVSGQNLQEY